jgi:hypothetical protein
VEGWGGVAQANQKLEGLTRWDDTKSAPRFGGNHWEISYLVENSETKDHLGKS